MHHRLFPLLALGFALSAILACGDDVTDPDGLMESAEAEAVMRSADALPLLPSLLDTVDDGQRAHATLLRARELWDAGATGNDARAAARRRLAVGYALPALAEHVPAPTWIEARERTDDWMATAGAMLRHLSMPRVEARLDAAAEHLRRSDAALSQQNQIYHLLLAGSELVETTPRYVARTMAAEATLAVREAEEREGPLPGDAVERAQRLKDWAVAAVEEGEYLLAIQRAYYAIQLVEDR
ncbi:MAG: hypothetical protein ACOC3J_03595 [Gemmatimonadota bacterium]